MNLYVSNLGFQVTDEELKALFTPYGEVTSAKVVMERETGRSRGFGFVEMADKAAQEAMKDLEGKQVDGRAISVSQARPKTDNRSGGGGGSYNRGGKGGGGSRW
ncbi:MAG TPA: RNA-binding protein [Puia sp.]|jgi:RNA recognition motif-containing protein|nr:RNA-binding protein [Puia sp.]